AKGLDHSELKLEYYKDAGGREGITIGAIAKELEATPAVVKKALAELKIEPDFVKGGCSYYYQEHAAAVKQALE
ncbi:MAG: hypothetical protein M1337_04960, partial [Actinobacteria bacterium]|nr:hypothetical protein [Actinomycetota bacterium]